MDKKVNNVFAGKNIMFIVIISVSGNKIKTFGVFCCCAAYLLGWLSIS